MKSRVNSLRKRTIIIHFPGHHIGHPTFQGSDLTLFIIHPDVSGRLFKLNPFRILR